MVKGMALGRGNIWEWQTRPVDKSVGCWASWTGDWRLLTTGSPGSHRRRSGLQASGMAEEPDSWSTLSFPFTAQPSSAIFCERKPQRPGGRWKPHLAHRRSAKCCQEHSEKGWVFTLWGFAGELWGTWKAMESDRTHQGDAYPRPRFDKK